MMRAPLFLLSTSHEETPIKKKQKKRERKKKKKQRGTTGVPRFKDWELGFRVWGLEFGV